MMMTLDMNDEGKIYIRVMSLMKMLDRFYAVSCS
jgi:hypothetical protein